MNRLLHAILCYFEIHKPEVRASWSRCRYCYAWTDRREKAHNG